MVNKIVIVGNVGKDPEITHLENGKVRAEFSIATTHKFKNKNTGETEEQVDWHRIEAWSKLAEIIESYVKKGLLLYVEGRQRQVSYISEGGSGEKKTKSYINAHEIKILTPKNQ